MSNYIYNYKTILANAKTVKNKAEKEYAKTGAGWSYYFAKSILKPKTDIKKISIKGAEKSTGNDFGRQIKKSEYTDMAKRFTAYVEKNGRLPNYISIGNKKMRVSDYTLMFANILVSYDKNGILPDKINVNSKVYIKPTEYPNKVYGLWVKYIKTKPKYLDDVCDYIKAHFNYQFYFDDEKSNEEVLKTRAGNCTDLLQMLTNMADAMDYEWVVYHVKCRQSGTGHVYGKFRKKDGSTGWFTRDISCIADESRYCVWCDSDEGKGYLQAKNPSWFLQNRNR